MNIAKKSIAALTAVSMMLAGFTGCGADKNESGEFEPKLDTEAAVSIEISGFFGNFEALDQVEANFNEYYPNVTFSYEQVGGTNLCEFVKNNQYLDIFMTSREHLRFPGMNEKYIGDKCADLNDIIDTGAVRDDMLSDFTVDGELLSLPMAQKMYGMAVNKTLLEKEGLEMPKNYSEFLSVLDALKNKGYVPIQGASSCIYSGLVNSEAMDILLSDESLKRGINSGSADAVNAMASVYSQIQTIIDSGYTDREINAALPFDNYDGSIMNFLDGDVPFWICDTEKFSGVKKRESKSESFTAEPFEYEFTLIPMGEKGVYEYSEPWCGFSLNKESDVYDYAAEFLRFAAGKDQLEILASVKGVPSVTEDSASDERYTAVESLSNIEMSCVMDGSIENHVMSLFATYANKIGEGEMTSPEEAAQELVNKCTEITNDMQ